MRFPHYSRGLPKMANYRLHDNGDARDAIYRSKKHRIIILVGVQKR
jgi:hypothetical protein